MTAGNLLPRLITPPPGPRARALCRELAAVEAPGVNTVGSGHPTILWEEARGANVVDVDGNRYIDLTSGFGVAAVGHRHPAVVAAVRRQAGRLLAGLGDVHAHPARVALAARLARLAPMPDAQVYFTVSGAEAVELALKTALAATGRPGILAFSPAYHGLTLGALAVTSRAEFRQPFAAHLHRHVRRLPFGCAPARAAKAVAGGGVGAVIFEPVVGREGVLLPPAGWLQEISRLAREAGALVIADEIFTGFGRTGTLFAVQAEGVVPDLLCCGKAVGGGLPLSAVLGRRSVLACWSTPGEALHTSTFLAHPLSCAAALATLDVLEGERLVSRAAGLGRLVAARLATWPERFPVVRETRGRGLLWGVELCSREAASRWVEAARAEGLLLLSGGPQGRVAQIAPPLAIARRQLEAALALLESAFAKIPPPS